MWPASCSHLALLLLGGWALGVGKGQVWEEGSGRGPLGFFGGREEGPGGEHCRSIPEEHEWKGRVVGRKGQVEDREIKVPPSPDFTLFTEINRVPLTLRHRGWLMGSPGRRRGPGRRLWPRASAVLRRPTAPMPPRQVWGEGGVNEQHPFPHTTSTSTLRSQPRASLLSHPHLLLHHTGALRGLSHQHRQLQDAYVPSSLKPRP